jgi:hypothetical protein
MYKVQGKETDRPNQQSNIDTKVIEEALKMMRLLITWKMEHLDGSKIDMMLVEYDDVSILNEDKLIQLYNKIDPTPFICYGITWLMCDNTSLNATCRLVYEESLGLEITISKGIENGDATKLMWIDSKK